jgi:flagellar M-ring protein FliF
MAEAKLPRPVTVPLFAQLPPAARQLLLLVGLAAAVAAGVAAVLWSQSPQFVPLYTGLADRDASDIVSLLDGGEIAYRLDPTTGALLVPSDRKYDVRMQLAAAGLPRGTGFGIEQMPERSSFGQTPFMENALYVHAVENELARSIGSMQPVEAARVHLALPPQSVFLRRERQPSASVMLKLFAGRRLDQAQVQAVVHLVASSVPELTPSRVTVVDQTGALLTSQAADGTTSLTSTQFEYRRQVEEEYARRIESLLGSVVGAGRVRASVSAELDFTISEQTRESFDPNVALVRSEQTSEETRRGELLAQGVPGALSNQPPQAVAATDAAAQNGAVGEPNLSTSRSQVRNFELDKTISHTKQAPGTIQRLSVGVLVDNKPAANGRGPSEPLAQADLDSLTELVKQAIGFDMARGDTLSLLNSAFQPAPQAPAPVAASFWEQPALWSIVRQVIGGALVLVLAFVIVRPVMSMLTRPPPATPVTGDLELGGGRAGPTLSLPGGRQHALPVSYEDRMAAARGVAGQDPRQVAQVVRGWVAQDNG